MESQKVFALGCYFFPLISFDQTFLPTFSLRKKKLTKRNNWKIKTFLS